MLTTLKIAALAVLFVATGGAIRSEFGRRNRALVLAAACVSMVGAYYLGRSIYNDLKAEVIAEIGAPEPPSGSFIADIPAEIVRLEDGEPRAARESQDTAAAEPLDQTAPQGAEAPRSDQAPATTPERASPLGGDAQISSGSEPSLTLPPLLEGSDDRPEPDAPSSRETPRSDRARRRSNQTF